MKLSVILLGLCCLVVIDLTSASTCPAGYETKLFGGDILLSPRQRVIIDEAKKGLRKGTADLAKIWTHNIVPYAIDSTSENDRAVILEGINHWKTKTCLTFEPYDSSTHTNYITFIKCKGCWSELGMEGNGEQLLSIGPYCEYAGTVIHEIGHAIGFEHEHQRPDRDKFIDVHIENAQDKFVFAFDKYGTDVVNTRGIPYDVGSIMHYEPCAFSKNGELTITAKNPINNYFFGQDEVLSRRDIQLAKEMYACPDIDDCDPNPCQNGGHCVDGKNVYTCFCTGAVYGETCQLSNDFCKDTATDCATRAADGECKCGGYRASMKRDCPVTCKMC